MKAQFKRPFSVYVKKARKPLQLAVQDAVDAVCANPGSDQDTGKK